MTNWGQLSHALGSAEDIPAMLDLIEAEPTPERWNDLWTALCNQSSVFSASFAALARLAQIAERGDAGQRTQALTLAGAIVGSRDRPRDLGDVRATYAADIAALLALARQHLPSVTDRAEYIYLVESVLAFEGHDVGNEPLSGLADEEYELECPSCTAMSFIVIGPEGYFATIDDYATEENPRKRGLVPADPSELTGLPRKIHDDAVEHGHTEFAIALTYLFGQAVCTDCGESFDLAEQAEVAFR